MPAHRKPLLAAINPAPAVDMNHARVCRRGCLSVKNAAAFIGMSPSFVKELIADGVVEGFKLGTKWVVPKTELVRYLAEQRAAYFAEHGGRGSLWATGSQAVSYTHLR